MAAVSESASDCRSLFGRPRTSSYKAAVAKCIRELKAKRELNNVQLAELLGCDEKTIRNAEDGDKGALDVILLLNIAYAFGEEAIAPVRALYLCTHAEPKTIAERFDELQAEIHALRREVPGA